tara:strand:- start:139 stop:375 length:237 start_codon:yes stop_codon:yes gene_type:complete
VDPKLDGVPDSFVNSLLTGIASKNMQNLTKISLSLSDPKSKYYKIYNSLKQKYDYLILDITANQDEKDVRENLKKHNR